MVQTVTELPTAGSDTLCVQPHKHMFSDQTLEKDHNTMSYQDPFS